VNRFENQLWIGALREISSVESGKCEVSMLESAIEHYNAAHSSLNVNLDDFVTRFDWENAGASRETRVLLVLPLPVPVRRVSAAFCDRFSQHACRVQLLSLRRL
jgi:hypothetical protein